MSNYPDYSLLELASVREGDSVGTTLKNSVAYAQHAEKLGFKRFWLAEHHNMEGISSSATSVLIGHIAGKTQTIRVGSGGVMLPNHRLWSSPSSSALWKAFTRAALIWALAVRRAQTR